MGRIYLLHFDSPISDKHTCQHYIGFTTKTLRERIADHRAGKRAAARLTQVAKERGISFTVVRTWQGTRKDERRLKDNKNAAKRYCPICRGEKVRGYLSRYNRKEDTNATGESHTLAPI